jgi:hypothetical protein
VAIARSTAADAGHLAGAIQQRLALAQRVFLELACGDVEVRAEHPFGLAVGCPAEHAPAAQHPHPVAVAMADPHLALVALGLPCEVPREQFAGALQVVGVHP